MPMHESSLPHAAITRKQLINLLERAGAIIRKLHNYARSEIVTELAQTQIALARHEELREPPLGVSREDWLRAGEDGRKRFVRRARD